jgi:hypothetical protein
MNNPGIDYGFSFCYNSVFKNLPIQKTGEKVMGKFVAIIGGSILMGGGIYLAIFVWWREFYELVFGSIPPMLLLIGLVSLIAGISSIKDKKRIQKIEPLSPESESETESEE